MILPVRAIGDSVLKRKCEAIDPSYKGLNELIANMFDTMYNASGIGIAAPQVGLAIRLFVVDTGVSSEEDREEEPIKTAFINPEIVGFFGKEEPFEEGCLSIPDIRCDVMRPEGVKINYLDQNFKPCSLEVGGLLARVIQHEYDHVEGILFTDRISPLKKNIFRRRLDQIAKGNVKVKYPMRFPSK